jgi:hypothetical protein
VCSSLSCRVLAFGFKLGTYASSCIRILIGSHSPPSGHLLRSFKYHIFSQKPSESLDGCFVRFESVMSSLRSCRPLAYSDNERAKQLLYALDDSVWGMKIIVLEESLILLPYTLRNYLASSNLMNCLGKVILIMMLLLLVRFLLLVLVLMAMMPTHQHHCLICFRVYLVLFHYSF